MRQFKTDHFADCNAQHFVRWRVKLFRGKDKTYIENRVNAFLRADGIAVYQLPVFAISGEYILATIHFQPTIK